MSLPALAAALIAGGIAFGMVLLVVGIVGTTRPAGTPPLRSLEWLIRLWQGTGRSARRRRNRQALIVAAAVTVIVVWAVSGWPVAGLIAGACVIGVPWLFTVGRDAKESIARLKGVEAWTRRLAATVSVGVGLQQAITTSRRFAPPEVAEEVGNLVTRLQAGENIRAALLLFAEELNDAAGDQVVAALLLHAKDQGQHLHNVLTDIAETVAREVSMREIVEAQRAEPRLVTKIMTGLTVVTVALGALNPDYVRPYQGLLGQLVLLGLAGMFTFLLVWIRNLTMPSRVPRFLNVTERFPR